MASVKAGDSGSAVHQSIDGVIIDGNWKMRAIIVVTNGKDGGKRLMDFV